MATGASRGIGRATAIRLARDFTHVVIIARSYTGLEAVAEAQVPFAHDRASCALASLRMSQRSSHGCFLLLWHG
ncbi:MAG: SDR family NAD(P)-dependent oxidoreductase [Sphingomonadales bacterium]|nr:SDR family NAD(P)-dependent oxidoreductase [Sphingomonadales bacterium]MDE2171719.1 SDR family NAD(P)-dependent oxidoreductase [Sphingomonadales bacterium]